MTRRSEGRGCGVGILPCLFGGRRASGVRPFSRFVVLNLLAFFCTVYIDSGAGAQKTLFYPLLQTDGVGVRNAAVPGQW